MLWNFCNGFSNVCTIAFSTCITLFCIERAFVWKVTNLGNPIGTVREDKSLYLKVPFYLNTYYIGIGLSQQWQGGGKMWLKTNKHCK